MPEVEAYADQLRRAAGQRSLPVDVELIASVLGVSVRRSRHDFAGCLYADGSGRLVLHLNASDPPVRQRFTCAHELMHTAFGEERLCEAGAAALLMPRELVHGRYDIGYGLTAVEALARDARVSLRAAGSRLTGLADRPVAFLVLERAHRPADGAALRRGGLVPRRLRVAYAVASGLDVHVPAYAAARRDSVLYRALGDPKRPLRGREHLPGAALAGTFEIEARAYGRTVLAVVSPDTGVSRGNRRGGAAVEAGDDDVGGRGGV